MSKHHPIDSATLPVPILPCGTGGLIPWAFTGGQLRVEARGPVFNDAVYCLDAPAFIPSGAFSFDGLTSYIAREIE